MVRKKKFKTGWQTIVAFFLVTAVIFYAYSWWQNRKSRFVKYEAFGIPIPENFSIHGIDVSRYQQTIAWDVVKEMKVKT